MIKCFTSSWQCLLDCNASILKQYFRKCNFLSFKYMAVDSNMIHICIYIFTIKLFSRYIQNPSTPHLLLNGPETLKLHLTLNEEFVPWLSQNSLFGMLKRDHGRWTHESALMSSSPFLKIFVCRQERHLLTKQFGRTSHFIELILTLLVSRWAEFLVDH